MDGTVVLKQMGATNGAVDIVVCNAKDGCTWSCAGAMGLEQQGHSSRVAQTWTLC